MAESDLALRREFVISSFREVARFLEEGQHLTLTPDTSESEIRAIAHAGVHGVEVRQYDISVKKPGWMSTVQNRFSRGDAVTMADVTVRSGKSKKTFRIGFRESDAGRIHDDGRKKAVRWMMQPKPSSLHYK